MNSKQSLRLYISFLITAWIVSAPEAFAQPVGAPILTQTQKMFTLSFNVAWFRNDIAGVRNSSSRFLFKGIYGLGNRLDVYGQLGLAKLDLRVPQADPPNFNDKYRLAFGGGFTYRFLTLNWMSMSLFVSGQLFRFTSNPSSERNLLLGGSNVSRIVEFQYDWREANTSVGFIERLGNFKIYGGFNGKLVQRKETRISRSVIAGVSGPGALTKGEYLSGLQLHPFLGIDIMMPSRLFLSAEVLARSRNDLLINIGISQTGKP
ncbi:hypothetical protein MJD09_20870 [bacterium]|nr:hypothetical protein [bacterium]